ncbi:MAG TPA: hypothetical protein VF472_21055 [Burkholderiaceae bacterium]
MNYYQCTGCGEKFNFPFSHGKYYVGKEPLSNRVHIDDLLTVLARPVWCKDCDILSLVEDIAPLQIFEGAFATSKAGKRIEYPVETESWGQEGAVAEAGRYLRWRMERVHGERALCCGGSNYQRMDVPEPLFKHRGCDFGVVEAQSRFFIGPHSGWGPGVRSVANFPVWDSEGVLLGRLTWFDRENDVWQVEPANYPLLKADEE